jgi:tetratricopeptide (TPR) repeat protein
MKTIIALIASSFLVVALSCDQPSLKVVHPEDYSGYLLNREADPEKNSHENMLFWKSRLANNPQDATAALKVASQYASLFNLSGHINDLTQSDSIYRSVLRQSMFDRAGILRRLAANSISRHEFWQAKKLANEAIRIAEDRSSSLYLLTDILIELGNIDSAKIILSHFTNKNSFAWLIRQAKVQDHEGRLDLAILTMEKAQNIVKSNKDLFCWSKSNLADMYGHAGRIKDAYQSYLEVLKVNPDYDYAIKGLAWIALSHDHDTGEAEGLINHLMRKSGSPDYLLILAEIEGLRNNPGARQRHLKMFEQKINSPMYGNMYNRHLASVLADDPARTSQAVDLARKDIHVRPTAESYDALAWALFKNNQAEKARFVAGQFVEGRTTEPEVLFHLGQIFADVDQNKSRSYLRAALENTYELGPLQTNEIQRLLRDL